MLGGSSVPAERLYPLKAAAPVRRTSVRAAGAVLASWTMKHRTNPVRSAPFWCIRGPFGPGKTDISDHMTVSPSGEGWPETTIRGWAAEWRLPLHAPGVVVPVSRSHKPPATITPVCGSTLVASRTRGGLSERSRLSVCSSVRIAGWVARDGAAGRTHRKGGAGGRGVRLAWRQAWRSSFCLGEWWEPASPSL